MTDTRQQSSGGGINQSYIHTTEIVERPPADRPVRDTIDAIAEWLIGPALQVATGAQAVDEFAWRMLAAGFPLARLTVHSGTLHPQFLGTSFIWWRDTGQTVQTFIAHEVADVVPYQHNPVLRVIQGGETLRRRVDEADDKLDLPILRDLKVKGCTDYLALPMAGAHGRRYAITYTTDCVDGFSARQVAELTGISQRMSIACDSFTQRVLMRRLLSIYLGANAGPKVLAGQIRRGTGEELTAVLWSSDGCAIADSRSATPSTADTSVPSGKRRDVPRSRRTSPRLLREIRRRFPKKHPQPAARYSQIPTLVDGAA